MTGNELLTVAEMREADRLAIEAGVPSLTLMENAGRAVATCVGADYPGAKVSVLCGPGNNGGDGFVAARILKEQGFDVRLGLLGDKSALKGDAAAMAKRWTGKVTSLKEALPRARDNVVIVDALFGAGLSKPLDGEALEAARHVSAGRMPVVAVDVPSGLDGDSGKVLGGGATFHATHTVTFFRRKPGHVLYPGRQICGEIHVAEIGIPESVLDDISPQTFENTPALWRQGFAWPGMSGHKYTRGHALVVSGPVHATGAARLAARGALRMGAGLVSVASPLDAVAVNAAHLTGIMIKPFNGADGLKEILSDNRLNAVVVGPGVGLGPATRALVSACLESSARIVLDADALTSFFDEADALFGRVKGKEAVLTPHEGEFERLFPGLLSSSPSRLAAAREAAAKAGCVIVLKGPDTVVATPDGRAAINTNAPPTLATAGSGDVLAGFIAGLLAQGMDVREAACAAVWLHGECANYFGPGLIAEDLPEILPDVLRDLQERAL
jgi:hydroxyethylthiazole kinase-like uncharacterized protein yjeF